MARFCLALAVVLVCLAAPSFAQFGNQLGLDGPNVQMVPSGNSNLPAGQYVLTNLNSGLSLYVVINQQGQLLAQDPRVLHFNVQQGTALGQGQAPAQQQQQQSTGFGGLLKQGLGSFLQNKLDPTPNP